MDNDVSTDISTNRQGRKRQRLIAGAVAAAVVVGGTWQHSKVGTSGALGAHECPTLDANHRPSTTPAPEVNWSSCILTDADLIGANLAGAKPAGATLNDADLIGANLAGAKPAGATLNDADLAGANLTDADLTATVVTGANLRGVGPEGVVGAVVGRPASMPAGWSLHAGHFTSTAPECPNVDYTTSQPVVSPAPVAGVNWSGCDLHGAFLPHANLADADLSGAELYEANLTNTDLTRAELNSANLTSTDLTGAKLTEAHLLYATVTGARLANAILTGLMAA